MYIKLGKTRINYNIRESINKFVIISQITNSPTSFENPVLVNSSDELDIWFSKDFIDRSYFLELLRNDVTLYLYKPISDKTMTQNKDDSEFFDYSDWETLIINEGEVDDEMILLFTEMKLVETGNVNKYKAIKSDKSGYNYYIWKNNSWALYLSDKEEKVCLNPDSYYNEWDLEAIGKILAGDKWKIPVLNEPGIYWIWAGNRMVKTSQLPQNLENFSESLNNRDTLAITEVNFGLDYSYPEYSKIDKIGIYSDTVVDLAEDSAVDLKRIDENKDSLVFDLYCSANKNSYSNLYFVMIDPLDQSHVLYYNGNIDSIPTKIVNFCKESHRISVSKMTPKEFITELKVRFRNTGYTIETIDENYYRIYSNYPIKSDYFNNIPDFSITPNTKLTYNIIAKHIIDLDKNVIEFWSKTIGGCDVDDDRIKINIEKVEPEEDNSTGLDKDPFYRVTISKYNYVETFEGPTKPTEDNEERLDYQISRKSRLVYCSIKKPGNTIKEGDFILRGGINEVEELEWNKNSWNRSLDIIFNGQVEPVYPDFFLIPNINKYSTEIDLDEYCYTYYKKLLDYAKEFNCQFLIQNNNSSISTNTCLLYYEPEDSEKAGVIKANTLDQAFDTYKENSNFAGNTLYTVLSEVDSSSFIYMNDQKYTSEEFVSTPEGVRYSLLTNAANDFVFNYTRDSENRLVYFYNYMFVNGSYRPGYYVFIKGILTNRYSIPTDQIIYEDPIESNESVYEENDFEKLLEGYKSNYLINNNLVYFYKNYQNGINPAPTTTILARFVIDKVHREFLKNKWNFLGEKNMNKVQNKIEELIINKISNTYSIIKSMELTKFIPALEENKLDIEVEAELDDLVNKDITIDITVDFNDF